METCAHLEAVRAVEPLRRLVRRSERQNGAECQQLEHCHDHGASGGEDGRGERTTRGARAAVHRLLRLDLGPRSDKREKNRF